MSNNLCLNESIVFMKHKTLNSPQAEGRELNS